MEIYWIVSVLVMLALLVVWVRQYGFVRGIGAIVCRGIWVLPVVLAFFPETKFENLPRTIAVKPVHIFIDDSDSMKNDGRLDDVMESVTFINDECLKLGCVAKITRLSEIAGDTLKGFSPLDKGIESWSYSIGDEPWMIFSDGGDSFPMNSIDSQIGRLNLPGDDSGLIVGFRSDSESNIWLERDDTPIFAFAEKSVEVKVVLNRESPDLLEETVQVQAIIKNKVLSSINATFANGEDSVVLRIPLPALAKGRHLLTIKALPTADEKSLWDNSIYRTIEGMANTIGVLHLLGSPSWDGRFLRRYLKAEPKYDLISFFILRDPGDMQMVNERELSLIPFPVDRLFNEELPNFHIVVLQNFALFQFLEPAYQKNLVRFVKNGGGLLFLGGPRALQVGDYKSSALGSILPFTTKYSNSDTGMGLVPVPAHKRSGPAFIDGQKFVIELASPKKEQIDLANIFNQWKSLMPQMGRLQSLSGLHRMDRVTLKEGEHTPLLNARLPNQKTLPLSVASYPDKGRALWFFSDALYQVALASDVTGSRDVYQEFIEESFTWLLRQEIKKPIILRSLKLNSAENGTRWSVDALGSAGNYLGERGKWALKVCGTVTDFKEVQLEQKGGDNWRLSGTIPSKLLGGVKCQVEIAGQHRAFGSVESSVTTVMPEKLKDDEVGFSTQRLADLSSITGAKLVWSSGRQKEIQSYLDKATGRFGVSYPNRFKTLQDHYWMLDRWWIWFLILFLPLEILIRRWPVLTTFGLKTSLSKYG